MLQIKKTIIFLFFSFISLGCVAVSEQPKVEKAANPAALKCIEDGYEIQEIVMQDKVIPELICVNTLNNKQCKLWAYYHDQCILNLKNTL